MASPQGFICRSCLSVLPLSASHWDGECRSSTMDPGVVQAWILRQEAREQRNKAFAQANPLPTGESWWEVTELLGGVRDIFIRRYAPYWMEAQQLTSTEFGVAMGDHTEQGLLKLGWVTQFPVKGKLFGLNVFGYVDALRMADDGTVLALRDTKIKNSGSFYYAQKRGFVASDEDSAQVSMYVELLKQMGHSVLPKALFQVMYGANNPALDSKTREPLDGWHPTMARIMSMPEVENLRCADSKTSVGENVRILERGHRRISEGEPWRVVLKDIPLSCDEMFKKQKCPWYCGALYTCYGEAGRRVQAVGKPGIALSLASF